MQLIFEALRSHPVVIAKSSNQLNKTLKHPVENPRRRQRIKGGTLELSPGSPPAWACLVLRQTGA
jgi:hypothetical protein